MIPKSRDFHENVEIREFLGLVHVSWHLFKFGRPCRGLRTLTGLRPQDWTAHMTRRAFLSSKSNTAAGEIAFKEACQKLV